MVSPHDGIAALPAFNPDLEEGAAPLPAAVTEWRTALVAADAVLVSSPEYAHGMPGVLKNALDWVVGSGELVGKPVGVLSASTARFAHPQLLEVLATMTATLVPHAVVVLDMPPRGSGAEQIAADPVLARALGSVLAALVEAMPAARARAEALRV